MYLRISSLQINIVSTTGIPQDNMAMVTDIRELACEGKQQKQTSAVSIGNITMKPRPQETET